MPFLLLAAIAAPVALKFANDELKETVDLAVKVTAITAVAWFAWRNREAIAEALR